MAGTSGDGIDAACVRIDGHGERMKPALLWHRHMSFPPRLRRRLLAVMAPAQTTTEELTRLHADLGEAFGGFARSAIQTADRNERPSLIGLAGQTVCHLPGSTGHTATLQLGEAARVAVRTGLPTVAEFRQSDVAAGGQGAPLVPWTDWVLFRHHTVSRAIQNIGGVANVTWLPAGCGPADVVAFDTGPGNMVIDALVRHLTGGREGMDRDGRRARRGRVLEPVLAEWLGHPFLCRKPPKTTGRETFGRPFIEPLLQPLAAAAGSPDDWIATATALTARSIAAACRRFLPGFPRVDKPPRPGTACRIRNPRGRPFPAPTAELVLCGGGAENPALVDILLNQLEEVKISHISRFGIPSQAKEALSFAMLAAAHVDGAPANLPQATGAARPVILGRMVLP